MSLPFIYVSCFQLVKSKRLWYNNYNSQNNIQHKQQQHITYNLFLMNGKTILLLDSSFYKITFILFDLIKEDKLLYLHFQLKIILNLWYSNLSMHFQFQLFWNLYLNLNLNEKWGKCNSKILIQCLFGIFVPVNSIIFKYSLRIYLLLILRLL